MPNKLNSLAPSAVPTHVGIIMDGNRRWAKQNGLQVLQGHAFVANKVIKPLVVHAIEKGISFLTLWAFSTENWQRDPYEVEGLLNILRDGFSKSAQELHELGVRLQTVGDLSAFPQDIQDNIAHWIKISATNEKITVVFALNYGGRNELVRAVNAVTTQNQELTEAAISAQLDSGRVGIPDPDLIIRTGGEMRLSGFLTWQSVYAELYFPTTLMPDFTPAEFDKALDEYSHRHRRFGK